MVLSTIPARASRPDDEEQNDVLVAVGKVMASQARIERAWEAMRHEHATFTSMVIQAQRALEELEVQQRKRTRRVKWAAAMTPVALAALEAGKALLLAWLASKGVHP